MKEVLNQNIKNEAVCLRLEISKLRDTLEAITELQIGLSEANNPDAEVIRQLTVLEIETLQQIDNLNAKLSKLT